MGPVTLMLRDTVCAPGPSVIRCYPAFARGANAGAMTQTVRTVPPSMTNSAPWIAAARSEAR